MTSEEFSSSGTNALMMAKGALESLEASNKNVNAVEIRVNYAEGEIEEAETEPLEATPKVERSENIEENKQENTEENPKYELKKDTQKYDVLLSLVKNYKGNGLTSIEMKEVMDTGINLSSILGNMQTDGLVTRNEIEDSGHNQPKWRYEPSEYGLAELQRLR